MNSSKSESGCVRSYLLCQMSTNAYGGRRVSCVHVCVYSFLFLCVCVCEWSCYSSGGEWQRTGVIGSSLSPQTGGTFHHRGISFQFSKPRHTSDAINKVFFFFSKHGEEKCKSAAI